MRAKQPGCRCPGLPHSIQFLSAKFPDREQVVAACPFLPHTKHVYLLTSGALRASFFGVAGGAAAPGVIAGVAGGGCLLLDFSLSRFRS